MNSWRKFRNQLIEAGYTDKQIDQQIDRETAKQIDRSERWIDGQIDE